MTRAIALVLSGAAMTVAGVALWSVPAAMVLAGVLSMWVGLKYNFEEPQ